jgi:hypothetical protein
MDVKYTVQNIELALAEKSHPTVMMWNRLEGRPRTLNFDRALRAEVRDPLWMLSKQWQMGEFKGEDAGAPVFAKVHIKTTQLTKYQAADHAAQVFDKHVPLETKVEQRKIQFTWDNKEMRLDLRLQAGRFWQKLLKENLLVEYKNKFISLYKFELPAKSKATDHIYAHKEVWQQYAAIAGRAMDGIKLFLYLKDISTHKASDSIDPMMDPIKKTKLDELGKVFTDWFDTQYYQPNDEVNNAWKPSQLEYQFSCSAPHEGKEKVLSSEEYYQGTLDWYAFSINNKKNLLGTVSDEATDVLGKHTKTLIPAPIKFDGMPNRRWWTLEDGRTNLGDFKPASVDLAKLLLMEFMLVYSNDWFLIPFELPTGSLANIAGLSVTNTFGERYWIEASGKGLDDDAQRWSMFSLDVIGKDPAQPADLTLLLAPSAMKVQEGDPLEEIYMIRDEMANMVWGVETRVPLANGYGRSGKEVGQEIHSYYKQMVSSGTPVAPPPYKAPISYLAMTEVPEHWIPFVPVHKPDSSREIQLQRASMLRIIEGDDPHKPAKIHPRTTTLREGLDQSVKKPYYLFEEEVPRAGISVTQSFQRTRWTNGEVYVWLGMRKYTGKGEGSSGLAFDQVVDVKV